jgi:hypothetical protein
VRAACLEPHARTPGLSRGCKWRALGAVFCTGITGGNVLLTNEISRFSLIFLLSSIRSLQGSGVCSILFHNAAQPSLLSFSSLLLRPTGRRFSWIQLQRGPNPGLVVMFKVPRYLQRVSCILLNDRRGGREIYCLLWKSNAWHCWAFYLCVKHQTKMYAQIPCHSCNSDSSLLSLCDLLCLLCRYNFLSNFNSKTCRSLPWERAHCGVFVPPLMILSILATPEILISTRKSCVFWNSTTTVNPA